MLRLSPGQVGELLVSQLSMPGYLGALQPLEPVADRTYGSNEDLWGDVLASRVRASGVVRLEGFLLSEWLPFSAGTFHTSYGRSQRADAQREVLYDGSLPDPQPSPELLELDPGVDPSELGVTKVYSSGGKGGMIAGGIGSIRLKPRRIDVGEVWFMSASSTGVAHEGFPVAVPTDVYAQHSDELAQDGAVRCTVTGELRFVDNSMRVTFGASVPQLYLLVRELHRERRGSPDGLQVSVPISFERDDGTVHAAYANFRPGERGSLERAVEWLAETYVKRIYQGRVITDFDEQTRWFDDADFSLERVMTGSLDARRAGGIAERLRLGQFMTNVIIKNVELNGTLTAGRIETVNQDRVIQIGPGAQINAPIAIADSIEGSFNTIAASSADDDLKRMLESLTKAVAEAARSVSPEQAATMGSDLQTLAAEATRTEPRRKWYALSLESLRETAQTLGEIGAPILTLTAKIAELLP